MSSESRPLTSQAKRDYLIDFMPAFTLDPPRAALLVIDLQYASASRSRGLGRLLAQQDREADGAYRFNRIEQVVVPSVQTLLDFFRRHGLRVIYVTVGSEVPDYGDMPPHMREFARAVGNTRGNQEHQILEAVRPQPGEIVINKTTAGAFNSSSLDATLRTLHVTDLVITGVSTNSCVETTARDAADRGYRCLIVDDGCGAACPEFHEATLTSFRRLFGRVATARDVVEELEARVAR